MPSGRRIVSSSVMTVLVTAMILTQPSRPSAHDVPTDVMYQVFVKPEGQRLALLLRVPLKAIVEVEFPKRGPGYLDLTRADDSLREAATVWIANNIDLYEEDTQLAGPRLAAVRISFPSDPSFGSYEQALAHIRGAPLPADTQLYWEQGMLDVWLDYSIRSAQSHFSIHPGFARLGLRILTLLRFLPPGGGVRAFELHGDPGLVALDPGWQQAARRFLRSGFFHILRGTDHLLFLLCLVIPLRRVASLISVITAFTLAHSMTLIASAYNLGPTGIWFPPLIDTLIAVSILDLALENIAGVGLSRRWMIAFGFGLVHGFAFSFALRESLQFAGSHLLASLLAFNIGVELGQFVVLVALVLGLKLLFRMGVRERLGVIMLSAFVAHTSWHWTVERAERLSQFPWPTLDTLLMARALHWITVMLILTCLGWLIHGFVRSWGKPSASRSPAVRDEEQGLL